MNRQHNHYLNTLLMSAILSIAFLSCSRDNEADNSPARQIAVSENLVIPANVNLPENLPAGNTRLLTFFATGVQRYKAQEKAAAPGTFEWVFVAPQADLYDGLNRKVGTHSAGPTWQMIGSTTDSIYAQAFTPAKTAPSTEANTIDWLLLMPKTGKTPTGVFAGTSYIQRIATKGGKAPSALPTSANETVEVPYTAIYRFTRKNP